MSLTDTLPRTTRDEQLDPIHFRAALGHFGSGITIITGHDGNEPIGFTCQSFTSISLEPPLISFSVMTNSSTYPRIRDTGRFAVNILANGQEGLSNQFARKGTDKWAGVEWSASPGGNPALDGSLLWIDCDLHAEHLAGDHFIVLGRVRTLSQLPHPEQEPLLFFKGGYRGLAA